MSKENFGLTVHNEVTEAEILKRAYWTASSLILFMQYKTDYAYDKNMKSSLKSYIENLEARLFVLGERNLSFGIKYEQS